MKESGELTNYSKTVGPEKVSMAILKETSFAGTVDTVRKSKPSSSDYKRDWMKKQAGVFFQS